MCTFLHYAAPDLSLELEGRKREGFMVMHCTECSDVKAFPLKVVGNDFGATLHKSGHTVMLGYPKDHCVSSTSCFYSVNAAHWPVALTANEVSQYSVFESFEDNAA